MTENESGKGNTTDGTAALKKHFTTQKGVGNLIILPNVKTTATIERTISLLDPYFEDLTSQVTSGLRTAQDQLNIIIQKVEQHKIDNLFQEFHEYKGHNYMEKVNIGGELLYWWQKSWGKLLSIGEIVNPPTPAEVLFDYFRPGSNVNRKGRIIDVSNHTKGISFDIGGGADLDERVKRVQQAAQDGSCFIRDYLKEVVNGAIHVDCVPIVI